MTLHSPCGGQAGEDGNWGYVSQIAKQEVCWICATVSGRGETWRRAGQFHAARQLADAVPMPPERRGSATNRGEAELGRGPLGRREAAGDAKAARRGGRPGPRGRLLPPPPHSRAQRDTLTFQRGTATPWSPAPRLATRRWSSPLLLRRPWQERRTDRAGCSTVRREKSYGGSRMFIN